MGNKGQGGARFLGVACANLTNLPLAQATEGGEHCGEDGGVRADPEGQRCLLSPTVASNLGCYFLYF